MSVVNRALTGFFDLLLKPLDGLPVMAGLVVLSLVTAVGVLYAFKWTADQRALARAKRAMQAAIFEMRLFNDDLVALFRAQLEVLRHTLTYLRLSLAPTLWLIVPMVALMLHMEYHYGYTGLAIGEPAVLRVHFASAADMSSVSAGAPSGAAQAVHATLEAPQGVRVETPGVSFPSEREIAWRIRPSAAGAYELRVQLPGAVLPKTLLVSEAVGRRSPVRPDASWIDQLLYPSEPPVPAGTGVTAVTIDYPEREVMVAGWNVGWAGVYLALTLLFAFVLKRPLGVEM